VTFGGVTQVTGADGISSFTVLAGTYQLEIVKEGYNSWSETVPINNSISLSRGISATPLPPATDLNPLMAFIYPPLSVTAFALVYTFAAYILMKRERTMILNRIGFAAWVVALLAMIDGLVWGRASTTFFTWVPDPTTILYFFVLVSATMMLFGEGKTTLSKLLVVASCIPPALILPYYFSLVSLVLLILVTAFRFDAGLTEAKSPQVVHRRMIASKLNRVISWLFIVFSVFSLSTGYIMTRLNLDVDVTFQIHELLGYSFAALLVVHVLLTLLAGYPWRIVLRNFRDRRTAWSIAMFLQVVTALLLIIFSGAQVLTGLGWAFPIVASIVPILLHIRIDELLFSTLIVHGAVGVKFALTRRRIKVPRIDYILVLVSVVAIALVFLYRL
jgi:preprotein translocase subunit SecG